MPHRGPAGSREAIAGNLVGGHGKREAAQQTVESQEIRNDKSTPMARHLLPAKWRFRQANRSSGTAPTRKCQPSEK